MSITVLAEAVVDLPSGGSAAYTHSSFAVPPGTDCLVVDLLNRGYSSGVNAIDAIAHNDLALTIAHDNNAAGFDDINSVVAWRRNPDIGTFDIDVTFDAQVRGIVLRIQALAGVKAAGSPIGQIAWQRLAGGATDTVGLGLTPAATADSLLCASLGVALNTTLATWTGAGFTDQGTGQYTGGDNLTATFRRRLNAPASANTAQAKFGASDVDIGGLLYEILAEPTGVDVAGTIDFEIGLAGQVSGPSSARLEDAAFLNGQAAVTDIVIVDPDLAGVDRRLLSAGPALSPNLTIEQVAAGESATSCWRWRQRMTTGTRTIETAAGSQAAAPRVLAFVLGPEGAAAYLDGVPSMASSADPASGVTDIGAGGLALGGHDAATPAAYTGKVARLMRYDGALSAAQISLLSRSLADPDSIWGYGEEDDAQDPNRSPVALPMLVEPDGRPLVTLHPRFIDPNGVPPAITGVTQPAHGTVTQDGPRLVLALEPGWQGVDGFTYTVDDGDKESTGKVAIRQGRPALKAVGDSISVAENGSVTFNPRLNDIGAGPLFVVDATTPAHGAVTVNPDGTITYQHTGGGSTDAFSYTLADDYGQASAEVAVTIETDSFVRASPTTVETTQGVPVEIDVLANATASADNLPLVVATGSVTAPSPSGTAALQSSGRILYSPASGFTGDASFACDVKPSSKPLPKATASVSVRVLSQPSGNPKHPPTVANSRILTVGYTGPGGTANQYDSLDAAFGAVPNAGNYRIRLNDAAVTKSAGWDLGRVFGDTVVIESRNPLGATLNGRIFAHRGRKLWLYQLVTNAPPSQLAAERGSIVCNKDFTITRCRILGVCGVYMIANTDPDRDSAGSYSDCRRVYIGWNAFKGQNDSGISSCCHIKMRMGEGSANPSPASAIEFDDFAVYRNYFYDSSTGNLLDSVAEAFNFYAGNKHTRYPAYYCSPNGLVEYNFSASGNRRRFLYFKRAIRRVQFNHCAGFKNEPFTQRHGWDARWIGNRCSQGGGNMLIGGGRLPAPYSAGFTEVIGNILTGGLHLKAGTSNGSTDEQGANYALVVGNQCGGQTIIGHRRNDNFKIDEAEGGKLKNLRFWHHTGGHQINTALVDLATCDIRPTFAGHGMTWGAAPVLSAAVVGLETAAQ